MDLSPPDLGEGSRLRLLLDRLSVIEDNREPHRVAYPLAEILLLAVCGTIADCDDYDDIGDWGEEHLAFLRRFLPYVMACRGAVADDRHEPGQSGAVLGLLHGLGARLLARVSRTGGDRRQDLAAQP